MSRLKAALNENAADQILSDSPDPAERATSFGFSVYPSEMKRLDRYVHHRRKASRQPRFSKSDALREALEMIYKRDGFDPQ